MNDDLKPEEMKRDYRVVLRIMVVRTRYTYEKMFRTAGRNAEVTLLFLKWHLIAYRDYFDAIETNEERARDDEYARCVLEMLLGQSRLEKLPPLPFPTPVLVVSNVG